MNADIQDFKYKELTENLAEENQAWLLNYLKAENVEAGLWPNFGSKAEFMRKAFDSRRK